MKWLTHWRNDLVSLIYPRLCCGCGARLSTDYHLICVACEAAMPRARFKFDQENPVHLRLSAPITGATALYIFNKGGRAQKLIHRLKYEDKPWVGDVLGREIARENQHNSLWKTIDIIVPIPLHPKKERERGYNQSLHIAQGIQEIWHRPMSQGNLIRTESHQAFAQLGREQRLQVAGQQYQVVDLTAFEGKHVLLVDDVLTTGATLETCALLLLQARDCKVSCATLGIAD
jgi:ComF family protein